MSSAFKAYALLLAIGVLIVCVFLWKSHFGKPGAIGFVDTVKSTLVRWGKIGPTDPDKFEKPKGAPTTPNTPAADATSAGATAGVTAGADTASGAAPASPAPTAAEPAPAAAPTPAPTLAAPTPGSMGDSVKKIREKSEKSNQQLENSLNQ